MRFAFVVLLILACPLYAEEAFPLNASDGSEILSPIAGRKIEVVDGTETVTIPAGMVYVPAGPFLFGEGERRELPGYGIGRFEVTNAEYKAFLDSTNERGSPRYWKGGTYPPGKANHPVLFVSLDDAEAYCRWIADKTGWKVVIPSAEQWEKAARGPQGFVYPWGNQRESRFKDGKLESRFNYNAVCAAHMLAKESKTVTSYVGKSTKSGETCTVESIIGSRGHRFSVTADGNVSGWIDHSTNTGFVNTQIYRDLVDDGGFTTAVGSFPKGVSDYGCHDMAGNAYEWTSTLIVATNGAERGKQVNDIRGGSWYSTGRSGISLSIGEGRQRRGGYHSVGFRIAFELPKEGDSQ